MPLIGYFAFAGLLLVAVLGPWIMLEAGLLNRESLTVASLMMAAGMLFFLLLWGRWWTLDRKANSVRYFPWRLCALADVRGVRVVQRRVGKYNASVAYAVDLELQGGAAVRFAGFWYAPLWARAEALALATTLGDWLDVPVTEQDLTAAA